uniref:Putative secreted protein n=1 Tax=Anopheles darlingi TaxID=43151 RepID=A0A2M4DLN1_ANODA
MLLDLDSVVVLLALAEAVAPERWCRKWPKHHYCHPVPRKLPVTAIFKAANRELRSNLATVEAAVLG